MNMSKFPLMFEAGHFFVGIEDNFWLMDTGSPWSFGEGEILTIEDEEFKLNSSYLGMTAETLAGFVGIKCSGILGADILGSFDHIIDCEGGSIVMSKSYLKYEGQFIHLDKFEGIPVLTAQIGSRDYRMFFDTGAQISYFQGDSLCQFPSTGRFKDFYPGFGQFEVDTYEVNLTIGSIELNLITGKLPDLLGATLILANTQGIIGNQILANQITGYSPRRNELYL